MKYIVDALKGDRHRILKGVLYILSFVYKLGVVLRNYAYDKGWLKQVKASIPVISVGNVVAGGSGKTPFTLLLASLLGKNKKVGILLRGYQSKAEKNQVPTRVSATSTAEEVGDEALIYAKRLPEAIVIAGRDRTLAAHMAFLSGAEVLLLDDGMQHRKIARDVDIAIVDKIEEFFLPRGFLRDDPLRLKTVDVIVFTRGKLDVESPALKVMTYIAEKKVLDWKGNPWPKSLEDAKIALFSGIAHPERFKETVEEMKGIVVAEWHGGDHQKLDDNDLRNFALRAKGLGATLLLCTEKDYVKMPQPPIVALPMAYLQITLGVEQPLGLMKCIMKHTSICPN